MPELPEVEYAARNLRDWLHGKTIERAEAEPTRIFRGGGREAFEHQLAGKKLEWLERRGKYLLLGFTGNVGLVSHLGMTGKWIRRPRNAEAPSHVRARLLLAKDGILHYRDPRLFGRIDVHPADRLFELPEIAGLGPDPLVDGIDAGKLYDRLHRTSRPVKVALMDQAVLAGVGNIQATEALFRAGVHPARPGHSLSRTEVERIAEGIFASIEFTLASTPAGEEIEYLEDAGTENPFLVYGRAGSPCPRCTTTLEKLVLGGRSSFFCPRCQHLR